MNSIQSVVHRTYHWMIFSVKEKRSASFLALLLTPCSWMYGVGVKVRNWFYDSGILRQRRVDAVVVSVGNIEVGGTGKTPLVLLLANLLSETCPIGVVLRGYRSRAEKLKKPLLARADAAASCGDEAALIAEKVPQAVVVSGKDRVRGAEYAIAKGAKIILLDDGMQHRKLYRDFEIVCIRSSFLGSKPKFLPAGVLRDDPKQLERADLVVEVESIPQGVFSITNGESLEISGKKVALFCGIGHPERFVKTVKKLGAHIVHSQFLSDHERPSPSFLKTLMQKAKQKGAEFLLCTEKDRVKIPSLDVPPLLTLGEVVVRASIKTNQEVWTELIDKIKKRISL